MSNFIVFGDKSEINYLAAYGEHKQLKGAMRDCLTFSFDMNEVSADEIFAKFNNEKILEEITLKNTSLQEEHLYYDYSIFDGMTIKEDVVTEETNNSPTVSRKVLYVIVGQITYSEKLERERNEQVETLSEVFADMIGGAV